MMDNRIKTDSERTLDRAWAEMKAMDALIDSEGATASRLYESERLFAAWAVAFHAVTHICPNCGNECPGQWVGREKGSHRMPWLNYCRPCFRWLVLGIGSRDYRRQNGETLGDE